MGCSPVGSVCRLHVCRESPEAAAVMTGLATPIGAAASVWTHPGVLPFVRLLGIEVGLSAPPTWRASNMWLRRPCSGLAGH